MGGLGLTSPENEITRYWGTLDYAGVDEYDIWGSNSAVAPDQRARTIRKWAELSFWFQPVSGVTGNQFLRASSGVTNIDMSGVGGKGGFPTYVSHRYMTGKTVWEVSRLYDALTHELR